MKSSLRLWTTIVCALIWAPHVHGEEVLTITEEPISSVETALDYFREAGGTLTPRDPINRTSTLLSGVFEAQLALKGASAQTDPLLRLPGMSLSTKLKFGWTRFFETDINIPSLLSRTSPAGTWSLAQGVEIITLSRFFNETASLPAMTLLAGAGVLSNGTTLKLGLLSQKRLDRRWRTELDVIGIRRLFYGATGYQNLSLEPKVAYKPAESMLISAGVKIGWLSDPQGRSRQDVGDFGPSPRETTTKQETTVSLTPRLMKNIANDKDIFLLTDFVLYSTDSTHRSHSAEVGMAFRL